MGFILVLQTQVNNEVINLQRLSNTNDLGAFFDEDYRSHYLNPGFHPVPVH